MTQPLGSAISISKGKRHEISESPTIEAKRLIGIDDLRNDDLLRYTNDKKGVEASPEDVLIAWDGANAGTIGYGKRGFIGSTIARLRIKPESKIFTPFLGLYLKSKFDYLRKTATGATIPHINRKALESIPLPKIERNDQIRIAHLLGKVEGLIAQRKQHLQQLDDLLKSVFLEMFGDPVRNEKGWDVGTSSSYAEKVMVGVVVKPASHYVESGVIALRSLNIKPNRIDLNDLVYFSKESNDGMLSKSKLQANDVVVVRTGKTGTAAVIPQELEGANCIDLIIVRPKPDILNPKYLASLLNSERGIKLVSGLEVGGIQKHFNVGALNKIPFPLPPIDKQIQFATIVEKVEALKTRYQQSLNDLENLYGALSQQAFKGELDLSRVPLPEGDSTNENIETSEDQSEAPITHPQSTAGPVSFSSLDEYAMSNPQGREALLHQVFNGFLNDLKPGNSFEFDEFWRLAHQRCLDYMDEDSAPFGQADNDLLKEWVFEALQTERLQQKQNITGEDEKGKPILGNLVELKVAAKL